MPSKELINSIQEHEGWRAKAYQDSVGVWTIGFGTNLQTLTIDKSLGTELMEKELERIEEFFEGHFPYLNIESKARRDVILEMAYNLGIEGVLKFKNMWAAIYAKNWVKASAEMLDSKWATQVGQRARKLADTMLRGEY